MFRNKSASAHNFAMIPRAEIPRSSFLMQKTLKTSFDSGYLVPVFCEEVLPGDTFNTRMTAFARLATPIFPFMDNLHLESFFFFVPNRLLWDNWQKFMGERNNPDDSINYLVPETSSPVAGYAIGTLQDYFGLPTVGQVSPSSSVNHSVLPLRAYNQIYNAWFKDENLIDEAADARGDGPDNPALFYLRRRGKRPDYFTGCLPWTQKGPSVGLPLGDLAPVQGLGWSGLTQAPQVYGSNIIETGGPRLWPFGAVVEPPANVNAIGELALQVQTSDGTTAARPMIYADLSAATAATINQIRQAFQIQKLLERDARGGTRYTEIVFTHFGVKSPDARLQRPEYLGGGYSPITINPVAQTAPTDATTPQGNLAAFGTALARGHGFTQSFTEHGYIIGLVNVRADITYQQGMRRHWSRSTRYDFYFPVFAMLGEQPVYNKEIYISGIPEFDNAVFGYQERWAELRYNPSEITSLMRSTAAGTIDAWHLAQRFNTTPTLNQEFIEEHPPIQRVVAVGNAAQGQEFIMDCFFETRAARPLPMYSVPGLVDHF